MCGDGLVWPTCVRRRSAALTEALIAARFLTTDRGSDQGGQPDDAGAGRNDGPAGMPVASLAHEALLTHWEKVAKWVERNRIKLRLRARVEQSRQRWEQSSRDASLLLAKGFPLAEGRQLLQDAAQLTDETTLAYVRSFDRSPAGANESPARARAGAGAAGRCRDLRGLL